MSLCTYLPSIFALCISSELEAFGTFGVHLVLARRKCGARNTKRNGCEKTVLNIFEFAFPG